MDRLLAVWNQRVPVAVAAAALGIALVLISELGDVHETRVFGALLISFGGIGLGVAAGLGQRDRWAFVNTILQRRVALAIAATVLLTLPILIALVAALVGSVSGSGGRNGWLVGLGVLVAVGMLAASIIACAAAIRGVAQALRNEPGIGTGQQPMESPK